MQFRLETFNYSKYLLVGNSLSPLVFRFPPIFGQLRLELESFRSQVSALSAKLWLLYVIVKCLLLESKSCLPAVLKTFQARIYILPSK